MDSAPAVDEGDRDEDGMLIANDRELTYNVPRSITHNAPLAGPSHPVHGHTARATNVWSGQADDVRVADYHLTICSIANAGPRLQRWAATTYRQKEEEDEACPRGRAARDRHRPGQPILSEVVPALGR